jgi:hypothetical protein
MSTLSYRGTHCGCPKCLAGQREKMIDRLTRDSLQIALRHAQEQPESWAFEGRPAGFPVMPTDLPATSFKLTWTTEVRTGAIAAKGVTPPGTPFGDFMKLYDTMAPNLIYAFMRRGARHPLYVGHVAGAGRSMRKRFEEHKSGKTSGSWRSGTGQLTAVLASSTDIYLRLGTYTPLPAPYRANPNMTRAIEGLVQELTQPRMWTDTVTTFEEEDEAELAELLEGEL